MRRILLVTLLVFAGCPKTTTVETPAEEPPPPPPPAALAWSPIPALDLTVGVAMQLDLRAYCSEPATIALDAALPAGVTLDDGVLAGTPAAAMAGRAYVATATSGERTAQSAPFTIEVRAVSAELQVERATPEQIALYLPLTNTPADARATVRYREASGGTWRAAHPLLRIHPEWNTGGAPLTPVDAFAGTIFDLAPGTAYEVEVTIGATVLRTVATTRALPAAAGAANVFATTSDDLQAVLDGLQPGDVLELANGTYDVSGLHLDVSGTPSAPIVVRGASRDGVVLRSNGTVLTLEDASHVVVEDLTLEGSFVDGAGSRGVSLWDGALQEFVTFRRLTVRGVDQGLVAWARVRSVLVYQCRFTGNNDWTEAFVDSRLTWDDDGIRVPGEGNCVFENTLHGFGDTLAVKAGAFSAAVFFYRNKISASGDDACEGDYGTRNMALYDNHLTNCAIFLSLDPLWGGPFYCFRNVCVNTYRGPFKWNNRQSGFLVYNNTIVRTQGYRDWGWIQNNDGELRNWSFRNNILVHHGNGGLLALNSGGMDPIDFTHNGWYPDATVGWGSDGGPTLAEAYAALSPRTPLFGTATRRHEDDRILAAEPFQTAVPVGADWRTEVTIVYVPALKASSDARNAGVAIPGITDGHDGAAPDMGAIVGGRSAPQYGAD